VYMTFSLCDSSSAPVGFPTEIHQILIYFSDIMPDELPDEFSPLKTSNMPLISY